MGCQTPKSGDIMRCVNVVDFDFPCKLGETETNTYIDKTMLRQCKTFDNVKLVIFLTFILSRGTNLILGEDDIQFSSC
jgi:hypothetical protein